MSSLKLDFTSAGHQIHFQGFSGTSYVKLWCKPQSVWPLHRPGQTAQSPKTFNSQQEMQQIWYDWLVVSQSFTNLTLKTPDVSTQVVCRDTHRSEDVNTPRHAVEDANTVSFNLFSDQFSGQPNFTCLTSDTKPRRQRLNLLFVWTTISLNSTNSQNQHEPV